MWSLSPKAVFSGKGDCHCHGSDLAGELTPSSEWQIFVMNIAKAAEAVPKQLERLTKSVSILPQFLNLQFRTVQPQNPNVSESQSM